MSTHVGPYGIYVRPSLALSYRIEFRLRSFGHSSEQVLSIPPQFYRFAQFGPHKSWSLFSAPRFEGYTLKLNTVEQRETKSVRYGRKGHDYLDRGKCFRGLSAVCGEGVI